jgi:hypothetical protein
MHFSSYRQSIIKEEGLDSSPLTFPPEDFSQLQTIEEKQLHLEQSEQYVVEIRRKISLKPEPLFATPTIRSGPSLNTIGLNDIDEDEYIIDKLRPISSAILSPIIIPSTPVITRMDTDDRTFYSENDALIDAPVVEEDKAVKRKSGNALQRLIKGGTKSMESLSDHFKPAATLEDSPSKSKNSGKKGLNGGSGDSLSPSRSSLTPSRKSLSPSRKSLSPSRKSLSPSRKSLKTTSRDEIPVSVQSKAAKVSLYILI